MASRQRFGLADLIGITIALTGLSIWAGFPNQLADMKFMALGVGGAVVIPIAALRIYRYSKSPQGRYRLSLFWLMQTAAAVFILWTVLSLALSDAPWQNGAAGALGRNVGAFALIAAVGLFMASATLAPWEIRRTINYVLAIAAVEVFAGLLQFLGFPLTTGLPTPAGEVVGTLGLPEVATAYYALLILLLLGRVFGAGESAFQRSAGSILSIVLIIFMVRLGSLPGQIALIVGIGVITYIYVFNKFTFDRWRRLGVSLGGLVVGWVVSGALILWALPKLITPAQETQLDLLEYWSTGWNTIAGLPIFGTGPDSLRRYAGEFQSDSLVGLLGAEVKTDDARNIFLTLGANLGVIAMLCAIVIVIGSAVLAIRRAMLGFGDSSPAHFSPADSNSGDSVAVLNSVSLLASVTAGLVAFITVSLLSIMSLATLSLGLCVAGLALSLSLPRDEKIEIELSKSERAMQTARRKQLGKDHLEEKRKPIEPSQIIATVVGVVLVVVFLAVGRGYLDAAGLGSARLDPVAAREVMTNPLSPCDVRNSIARATISGLPNADAIEPVRAAVELDPRCGFLIHFQSELAINTADWELAAESTEQGIEFDPLLPAAWVLRGYYFLGVGDTAGAQEALAAGEAAAALTGQDEAAASQLASLKDRIASMAP